MTRPVLYNYFNRSAEVLLSQYRLSSGQKASDNLGDNREYFCSAFLKKVLQPRLKVVSGELIDSKGNQTGQLDTIIIRDDTPCLDFGQNNSYLAEGALAVIEVKSNLQREKIKEAGKTLTAVKNLSVQPPLYSKSRGLPRITPLRIVFAFESASIDVIYDEIKNWPDAFDLICVLNLGVIEFPELSESTVTEFVNGQAASLAYLYYHVAYYGNSFISREINLGPYFQPVQGWRQDPPPSV